MNRIVAFLLLCLVHTGMQAQVTFPKIVEIVGSVNIDTLSSYVRILSGEDSVTINSKRYKITSRKPFLNTYVLAGDYIRSKLSGFGLTTYEQPFTTPVSGRNIYAVQHGKDTTEIYIVCAHYDAVTGYAADDNATGVAAVLEAARLLSRYSLEHTVIYAMWDREEVGLYGSKYFAAWASSKQKNIKGVINLDMLGWDGNSDGKAEIHTRNFSTSVAMASHLATLNSDYQIGLAPTIYNPGTTASDHSSFWTYNYPAILLIEGYSGGDFNPYYHTTLDRFSAINLSYFHRMTKLALAGISSYVIDDHSVQRISLNTGWNILSANVVPDNTDMKFLFHALITGGLLVKAQDETGNTLEDYGVYGGWVNNLDGLSPTEGYKVNVTNNCQLTLDGVVPVLPLKIPLKAGWNIIGYPGKVQAEAQVVVQQLINRGTLIKVQDKAGASIEDWGINGGWTNNIGNFKPGEGYKVKVSQNDTLTINETYAKSAVILPEALTPVHFHSVVKGNGVDHMNVNLVGIPEGSLDDGDEIGVFDGDICVGVYKVKVERLMVKDSSSQQSAVGSSQYSIQNPQPSIRNRTSEIRNLSIPVSASDSPGCIGFTEGHPFTLKIWKAASKMEYRVEPEILRGASTFRKNESTFASLENLKIREFENLTMDGFVGLRIFPNPTDGKVYIDGGVFPSPGIKVQVVNSSGQVVMKKTVHMNPGMIDLSGNESGIYILQITGEFGTRAERIVLR